MVKIRILIIIALIFSFNGCAYYKTTVIKARGKNISVPIGEGLIPVKGEGVVITVLRQVFLMPGNAAIQKFLNYKIEDEAIKGDLDISN